MAHPSVKTWERGDVYGDQHAVKLGVTVWGWLRGDHRDFPGDPVVEAPSFHCFHRGGTVSGNEDLTQ